MIYFQVKEYFQQDETFNPEFEAAEGPADMAPQSAPGIILFYH